MNFDRSMTFSFTARPDDYEKIRAAAEKMGISTSQFIREAALAAAEKSEQPADQQSKEQSPQAQ